MNDKINIIIASDEESVIKRWQAAVVKYGKIELGRSRKELIRLLDKTQSGQVFLDLNLPGLKGVEDAIGLINTHKQNHCLTFAALPDDNEGIRLLQSGARAYCNRYLAPPLLHRISELVSEGEVWLGASIMEKLIRQIRPTDSQKAPDSLKDLTEREMGIATLVAEGANNKVIAQNLDISERTVKAHMTSIFHKTDTKDRLQLALLVKSLG